MSNVTVTIDGEEYYPPVEGDSALNLILSDGTNVNITHNSIEKDGQTVAIPSYDLASGASDSLGSWDISFGPRQFQQMSCSGDILQCFTSAMSSFFSAASNVQDSLGTVAAKMLQSTYFDTWTNAGLSAAAEQYALDLSSMSSDLSSAASSLGSAIDAMDGAMSSVNAELGSLGDIELTNFGSINARYFEAYEYEKLQDIRSVLKNLAKIVAKVLKVGSSTPAMVPLMTAVKASWKLLTIGNGTAAVGAWSAVQFGTASTTDLNDLVASNGTINSTSKLMTNRTHFIHFNTGFSIDLFDIITLTLDNDAGTKTANDSSINEAIIKNGSKAVYGPGYTTRIPQSVGVLFSALPFVQNVYMHPTFEEQLRIMDILGQRQNITEKMYATASKPRHVLEPDSS